MKEYLRKHPSKTLNRIFLIVGFIVFIPVYSYILQLFPRMQLDPEEFSMVWMSFDKDMFIQLFKKLADAGHLAALALSFQLNILSVTGFCFAFFALTLIIARGIERSSKLSGPAFLFPGLVLLIAAADIISSIILLLYSGDFTGISEPAVIFTSFSYVFRSILLSSTV